MKRPTRSVLVAAAAALALLVLGWRLRGAPPEEPSPTQTTGASAGTPARAVAEAAAGASKISPNARAAAPSAAQPSSTDGGALDGGPRTAGDPALFGRAVTLVQSFALAEALARNAA